MKSTAYYSTLTNSLFGSIYAAEFKIRDDQKTIPLKLLVDTGSEGIVLAKRNIEAKEIGLCSRDFGAGPVEGHVYEVDLYIPASESPEDSDNATTDLGPVKKVSVCVINETSPIFGGADGVIGLGPKTVDGKLAGLYSKIVDSLDISNRFSVNAYRSVRDDFHSQWNSGRLSLGGGAIDASNLTRAYRNYISLSMSIAPEKPWYLVKILGIEAKHDDHRTALPFPISGAGITPEGYNALVDIGNQTLIFPQDTYRNFYSLLEQMNKRAPLFVGGNETALWQAIKQGEGAYLSNEPLNENNSVPAENLNLEAWPTLVFTFQAGFGASPESSAATVEIPPRAYWQTGLKRENEDPTNLAVFRIQKRQTHVIIDQTNLGLPFVSARNQSVIFDRQNAAILV